MSSTPSLRAIYRLRTLYTRCTSTLTLARLTPHDRKCTWGESGGGVGSCGGGALRQPRPWLGGQWAGLPPCIPLRGIAGCRAAESREARPSQAQEPGH